MKWGYFMNKRLFIVIQDQILNDHHNPLIIIKIKCTKLHLYFTNYYKSGLNKKDIPDYK